MSVLLEAADVELPYSGDLSLGAATDAFTFTISGQVSAEPIQFAINVFAGEELLFHANPRWTENRIVFNDCTAEEGWGEEEESPLPESLAPETAFTVVVTVANEEYSVQVNGEAAAVFKQRIPIESVERRVSIDKVDESDITVSAVKVESQ